MLPWRRCTAGIPEEEEGVGDDKGGGPLAGCMPLERCVAVAPPCLTG